MKKHIILLTLLSLLFPILTMAKDGLSGRDIAVKAKNANKSKNRIVWAELSVLDNGKLIETRKMINKMIWKKGGDRTIFRFINGLKRNVTFLSIEKGDNKDNLQYIYLPGVGRPRQISSTEKQNDFEDTDMTMEDMGGRKINDYTYKRLKDKTIKIGKETFETYVLIAKNKNKNARFPKYKFYVDKKSLIPVKAKIYGKDQKLKRIGIAANIRELNKGVYMAHYMYSKDLETNHETKMIALKSRLDTKNVKSNLFKPANLNKPWREK